MVTLVDRNTKQRILVPSASILLVQETTFGGPALVTVQGLAQPITTEENLIVVEELVMADGDGIYDQLEQIIVRLEEIHEALTGIRDKGGN